MRIILIGAIISTHSAKWVNSLSRRGHEVMLVSYPVSSKKNITYDSEVVIHKLRFGGRLGYYLNVLEMRRIYKHFKPDVVVVHYASGFGTMARLARLKPLVISCYGSDMFIYPFLNRFNMYNIRKNLRYADAVGCTSQIMAEQTRIKVMNDPDMKITVTPFGINTSIFHPAERTEDKDRMVVGIIKYLEPIYDIPLLINAFAIIHKEMDNKPLLKIYGDGHLKDELVKLTEELGVANDVRFMGAIPNMKVPKVLSGMDIFVNCSKSESFGVNMVEAMACGVPVVATNTPGAREVIVDGETGFIMKDREPETMAAVFRKLMNDNKLRIKMGQAGQKRSNTLYDWEQNLDTIEGMLKSVVKK